MPQRQLEFLLFFCFFRGWMPKSDVSIWMRTVMMTTTTATATDAGLQKNNDDDAVQKSSMAFANERRAKRKHSRTKPEARLCECGHAFILSSSSSSSSAGLTGFEWLNCFERDGEKERGALEIVSIVAMEWADRLLAGWLSNWQIKKGGTDKSDFASLCLNRKQQISVTHSL